MYFKSEFKAKRNSRWGKNEKTSKKNYKTKKKLPTGQNMMGEKQIPSPPQKKNLQTKEMLKKKIKLSNTSSSKGRRHVTLVRRCQSRKRRTCRGQTPRLPSLSTRWRRTDGTRARQFEPPSQAPRPPDSAAPPATPFRPAAVIVGRPDAAVRRGGHPRRARHRSRSRRDRRRRRTRTSSFGGRIRAAGGPVRRRCRTASRRSPRRWWPGSDRTGKLSSWTRRVAHDLGRYSVMYVWPIELNKSCTYDVTATACCIGCQFVA